MKTLLAIVSVIMLPLVGLCDPLADYPTKIKPGEQPRQQSGSPSGDPLGAFPSRFTPKESEPREGEAPRTVKESRPPMRLASDADHNLYRSFWPRTDEPWLDELKDRVIFYTSTEMPGRYQVWDEGNVNSGLRRVETGNNGVNANMEFPWADAAGTQLSANVKAVRFVHIPEGRAIAWRQSFRGNGTFDGVRWTYPDGTIFGEILITTDPEAKKDIPFEMRLREKTHGSWSMDSFRPFPTEDSLSEALAKHGVDFPRLPGRLDQLTSLNGPNGHKRGFGFADVAQRIELPKMSPSIVRSLLEETTFTSAKSKAWVKHAEVSAFSPTGTDSFGIVPRNFAGAFIGVNNKSCMRCHSDAGQFVPAGPEPVGQQTEKRWRVRGSDGILSFHIFNPASFGPASNGVSGPDKMLLNDRLVKAGLLVHQQEAQ